MSEVLTTVFNLCITKALMIPLILCLQSNKNWVVAGGLKKPDPKMHAANFQA